MKTSDCSTLFRYISVVFLRSLKASISFFLAFGTTLAFGTMDIAKLYPDDIVNDCVKYFAKLTNEDQLCLFCVDYDPWAYAHDWFPDLRVRPNGDLYATYVAGQETAKAYRNKNPFTGRENEAEWEHYQNYLKVYESYKQAGMSDRDTHDNLRDERHAPLERQTYAVVWNNQQEKKTNGFMRIFNGHPDYSGSAYKTPLEIELDLYNIESKFVSDARKDNKEIFEIGKVLIDQNLNPDARSKTQGALMAWMIQNHLVFHRDATYVVSTFSKSRARLFQSLYGFSKEMEVIKIPDQVSPVYILKASGLEIETKVRALLARISAQFPKVESNASTEPSQKPNSTTPPPNPERPARPVSNP